MTEVVGVHKCWCSSYPPRIGQCFLWEKKIAPVQLHNLGGNNPCMNSVVDSLVHIVGLPEDALETYKDKYGEAELHP